MAGLSGAQDVGQPVGWFDSGLMIHIGLSRRRRLHSPSCHPSWPHSTRTHNLHAHHDAFVTPSPLLSRYHACWQEPDTEGRLSRRRGPGRPPAQHASRRHHAGPHAPMRGNQDVAHRSRNHAHHASPDAINGSTRPILLLGILSTKRSVANGQGCPQFDPQWAPLSPGIKQGCGSHHT